MASQRHLVDTNVISELVRPEPDAGVLAWARRVHRIAVSAITVEEIGYGLARRPHPKLRRWFDDFFSDRCDVLAITAAIAHGAGRLHGRLAAGGYTRTQADMLIAATAQVHQLVLVTRNVKDFVGCGIGLLDPFGDLGWPPDEVHDQPASAAEERSL